MPDRGKSAMVPAEDRTILNAFTVDVEDYFQVQAFADTIKPRSWDDYPSRVVANTHRVLRLLDQYQVPGTFFVLGWIAERFPRLIKEIRKAGHEVGSHSYWHRLIYEMTPDEFRDDLRRSCQVIESITGEKVVAFRAPCFSVTEASLWALEILAEEGFRFDSSIFPVHHDTYGIPDAERYPHRWDFPAGMLWEFPPSVARLWNFNLPAAGGGYFRLYPVRFSLHCVGRVNRVERQPFMFYIHPWELDPEQPRLPGSFRSLFRHYQNLGRTERKLKRLLSSFKFGTLTASLTKSSAFQELAAAASCV